MRATTAGSDRYFLHMMTKNKKLVAAAGAALMGIGIWGMVAVGAGAIQTIEEGDYSSERGKAFQMNSYVFLFAFVAGLVAAIYSGVYSQAENAQSQRMSNTR